MRYTYTRCLEPLMWGGAQSPGWLHIGSFVKFSITEPLPFTLYVETRDILVNPKRWDRVRTINWKSTTQISVVACGCVLPSVAAMMANARPLELVQNRVLCKFYNPNYHQGGSDGGSMVLVAKENYQPTGQPNARDGTEWVFLCTGKLFRKYIRRRRIEAWGARLGAAMDIIISVCCLCSAPPCPGKQSRIDVHMLIRNSVCVPRSTFWVLLVSSKINCSYILELTKKERLWVVSVSILEGSNQPPTH